MRSPFQSWGYITPFYNGVSSVLRAGIIGLTYNPVFGAVAQHNVLLTAVYSGASSWVWQKRTGSGDWINIAGATTATFEPLIGVNVSELDQLRAVPNNDVSIASFPRIVRYAYPSGMLDVTAVGRTLTFALVDTSVGLQIDSVTMLVNDLPAPFTGSNPWVVTVDDAASPTNVRAIVAVSSSGGTRTFETSVNIPASLGAPVVQLSLAKPVYYEGEVFTIDDVVTTIVTAGTPPISQNDIIKQVRVDNIVTALPYTLSLAQTIEVRLYINHVTGPIEIFGPPVIVQELPPIIGGGFTDGFTNGFRLGGPDVPPVQLGGFTTGFSNGFRTNGITIVDSGGFTDGFTYGFNRS